jgi:hypothetical protein
MTRRPRDKLAKIAVASGRELADNRCQATDWSPDARTILCYNTSGGSLSEFPNPSSR